MVSDTLCFLLPAVREQHPAAGCLRRHLLPSGHSFQQGNRHWKSGHDHAARTVQVIDKQGAPGKIRGPALVEKWLPVGDLVPLMGRRSRLEVSALWASLQFGSYLTKFGVKKMSVKLRPLHDRVVVKRVAEEKTSPGGIVIPDSAAEKPVRGEVLAVGEGKVLDDGKRLPMDVKVGETIMFGKYSGTEVKLDGDELVVMRESDIMAVLD